MADPDALKYNVIGWRAFSVIVSFLPSAFVAYGQLYIERHASQALFASIRQ